MQARMGSTRLPGKVLMEAGGKPFLEHAFQRLNLAQSIDRCVIATTTEGNDDAIADFCSGQGWLCYRGPEQDVLARYYGTVLQFPADIIVRVTADCPLLDPSVIDQVVTLLLQDFPRTAYVSNVLEPRHFPRGLDVEAFTWNALKEAWQYAAQPFEREHVTPFLRNQPERFPQKALRLEQDHSAHRWTLDTAQDQQLLARILEHAPEPMPWSSILSLVEAHPRWTELNAMISQNPK